MLIVHAGNRIDGPDRVPPRFPATHADDVKARLRRLFAGVRPDRLVTAAAAGADLLAVEAALDEGVGVTLALPLLRNEFRRRSVEDQGGTWPARYDAALAAVDEVVEADLSGDDEWWLNGNDHILDVAADRATGRGILMVAVRAGMGSATDDLVERGARRGWPAIDLDPSLDPGRRPLLILDEAAPPSAALVAAMVDLDIDWVPAAASASVRDEVLRRAADMMSTGLFDDSAPATLDAPPD